MGGPALCYTHAQSNHAWFRGDEVLIMQWASALSQQTTLRQALDECAASIRASMGDTAADLAVVFASSEYASDYADLPAMVAEMLGPQALLLGCTGGGIIGGGTEIEQEPAVSITVASLPGVNIKPIRLDGDALPDMDAPPDRWHEALGVDPSDEPQFVLLADPMSFPAQNLLLGMDYALPQRRENRRFGQRRTGRAAKWAVPRSGLSRLGSRRGGFVREYHR